MRTDDGYIVHKCLNGDSAAFGLLVDKYRESIYGLAYSRLGDFHDAEDVTQEVFIKAYQKLRTLKRYDSFLAWLYSMTVNLCKNWTRNCSRRPDKEFIEDKKREVFNVLSIDSYRQENMLESVREALDSLPVLYSQVLILHYLSGMSSKEIAKLLGTSSNNIRQRLWRARAQLREEMNAMLVKVFEKQRLRAGFTFRIIEAVKRLKIQPDQRSTNLPWGMSLVAGIIIAVLSMGSHSSMINPVRVSTFAALPSETKVIEAGEIPVEIFEIDRIPLLASNQEDGNNGDGESLSPQRASFMAADGKTTFTNVAAEVGLDDMPIDAAPIWGDYDGDGDLDLYVAYSQWGWWEQGSDAFYRNNGDGTFTNITEEAGFAENKGACSHAGFLDYDNDGNTDMYVYNPTWNGVFDNRLAIYRNTGDGKFIDMTEETGIRLGEWFSWGGNFADYDNNGYLDLCIASWKANALFMNNGDGTFTDATVESGLKSIYNGISVASGDYDNDGDMDIYLSNGEGSNTHEPAMFFQNNGNGTFTEVTKEVGISAGTRRGRCTAFFDYNNDGYLDIITVAGTSSLLLYENNGDGTFTNVTSKSKLRAGSCERLAVGDYDNDGYMDVYLMPWGEQRSLYRNNGDSTFTNVTVESKAGGLPAKAGGCAFADYDNDGDLDLFEGNNTTQSKLYRNDGNDNHWLHVKCLGSIGDIPINIKRTNRDGVGARVIVKAGDQFPLSMIREINPGCSRGSNPLIAYFGLGQYSVAESVEVRWPSGQVDKLENIAADQLIVVKEGVGVIQGRAVEPEGKLPGTWGEVKRNELYQNYPNPFNPETWIPYQLARSSSVVMKIHTSSGKLVRTLELGDRPAGIYTDKTKAAYWDGNNDSGESVASGVYFYTIQTDDDYTATKKMVVAR